MKLKDIFSKDRSQEIEYYEGSTQKWLPVKEFKDGVIVMKDGRYVKVIEVLPVNFYLKSETEQQNIIYYYASYLKIAPDNMQIRVLTLKADISTYLERLGGFLETENNDECRNMIADEMSFVEQLSYNVAVKKRFFIAFDFTPKGFDKAYTFEDAKRYLEDEEYKARRYLAQCGMEVLEVSDNAFLTDLFFAMINKYTAKSMKPGQIGGMYDEVHTMDTNTF